jgi:hypothetical protein
MNPALSAAEYVHRGWVLLGAGAVAVCLTALQIWLGKSFVAFVKDPVYRNEEPKMFWFAISLYASFSLISIGLGLFDILAYS